MEKKLCMYASLAMYIGTYAQDDMTRSQASEMYQERVESSQAPSFLDAETSHRYISQFGFRDIAHFQFDSEKETLITGKRIVDPQEVKAGDIVFARAPGAFLEKVHPHIKNPYIFISHGDVNDAFKDAYVPYLNDSNIIAWFGIHPTLTVHPKFFPIPLGVIARTHSQGEKQKGTHKSLSYFRSMKKDKLIYINFVDPHRKDRQLCRRMFADKPFCLVGDRKPWLEYMKEMAQCKFTLSPKGIGIDCYRTWEALLVGSIPVVKSSQLNGLYKDLPIVVIEKWEHLSEAFLNKKYKELTSKRYTIGKLYMEYWYNEIQTVRENFLKNYR